MSKSRKRAEKVIEQDRQNQTRQGTQNKTKHTRLCNEHDETDTRLCNSPDEGPMMHDYNYKISN